MKLHTGFQLVPNSVTLNDPKWRNNRVVFLHGFIAFVLRSLMPI